MRSSFKKTAVALIALALAFGGGVVSSDATKDKLGNLEFVLGTNLQTALGNFRNQFEVTQNEPAPESPNLAYYTIRDKSGSALGYALFDDGKLQKVTREVAGYKSPENGKLVKDLIAALTDARANGNAPVRVYWTAEKPGNPEIRFSSGNRTVSVVYYEGGSETVDLSMAVGEVSRDSRPAH